MEEERDKEKAERLEPAVKARAVKKRIRIRSNKLKQEVDYDFSAFGTRRQARLYATQALYQFDMNDGMIAPDELVALEYEERPLRPKVRAYAEELIRGTIEHLSTIDDVISRHSTNWKIDRIGVVDKAILRFSIYSLFYQDDVPRSVVIDEAIELAKMFCDKKSYKFINGILDGIDRESEKT